MESLALRHASDTTARAACFRRSPGVGAHRLRESRFDRVRSCHGFQHSTGLRRVESGEGMWWDPFVRTPLVFEATDERGEPNEGVSVPALSPLFRYTRGCERCLLFGIGRAQGRVVERRGQTRGGLVDEVDPLGSGPRTLGGSCEPLAVLPGEMARLRPSVPVIAEWRNSATDLRLATF